MRSVEVSVDNLYLHLKQFGPGEHTTPICLVNTTGNHFKYYNIVVQVSSNGGRPSNTYIIQISYGRINKKPRLSEEIFPDAILAATWINQKFLKQRSKGYILLDKEKFYVEPCVGSDIAESKFVTDATTYITYKKVSTTEISKGKLKKEPIKDKRFNDLIFE